MFKPIEGMPASRPVTFMVDDVAVRARSGVSVALALLEGGMLPLRHSAVSHSPRAPLCLMGVCFECLVEVDGHANVQSCLAIVRDGMQVRRQRGAPRVTEDA